MRLSKRALRRHIFRVLRAQGFLLDSSSLLTQRSYSKQHIRRIHSFFRDEVLANESAFIASWFPKLEKYFASGWEVVPHQVKPVPVLIDDSNKELAQLFRLASLWWSVPVSRGFGRRLRFVILDESSGKLIGLLGLTDPVFNLRVRDTWVGWDVRTREDRLRYVMDAYVLGAVPPYNRLLGAKLIALIAASDFVRHAFQTKYAGGQSVIRGTVFDGNLAMITATSALGRSSVYNRLKFAGETVFVQVGMTEGYGHFHVANGTFEKLHAYLRLIRDDEVTKYEFGQGPNYRMRVVRTAFERLGLPGDLLRHGIKRETYVAPFAKNTAAFLRGEATHLEWQERPLHEVVNFWRERWLLPRAARDETYKDFDTSSWQSILRTE